MQQANEMIQQHRRLQGFWEAYVGPFDIGYSVCPATNEPSGLGIRIAMTHPVVYLSPLAGAPC